MRKNIKNYTSNQSLENTAGKIQRILAKAGAKKILFDYTNFGELEAISFSTITAKGEIPIRLPAKVERVAKVMYGEKLASLSESKQEQAKRTAWKNIQDWIDAQTAMLETEMVKLEEIFLPYMTTPSGETFFEHMENKDFYLTEGVTKE